MNIFTNPRLLSRPDVCSLLGIEPGLRPEFGVRALIAMCRDEVDRTELYLRIGSLVVEAKLTESGFGSSSPERLLRCVDIEAIFSINELPRNGNKFLRYQLIRGVLAAQGEGNRFALFCDGRRAGLCEMWFSVLSAVRSCEVRNRMALMHWQELAAIMPPALQKFLEAKYGIRAA